MLCSWDRTTGQELFRTKTHSSSVRNASRPAIDSEPEVCPSFRRRRGDEISCGLRRSYENKQGNRLITKPRQRRYTLYQTNVTSSHFITCTRSEDETSHSKTPISEIDVFACFFAAILQATVDKRQDIMHCPWVNANSSNLLTVSN